MKNKFKINDLQLIICDDKIQHDESKAVIHKVLDDEDYSFDAITCLARPVEFSIVNQLYNLDKKKVKEACDECNKSKKIKVLSTQSYHLILCPLIERYTFFGKDQAEKLSNQVIDTCNEYKISTLRITQFCMMLDEFLPIYDQFKGILHAFSTRSDSTIKTVYFDVPEKNYYQLKTLFATYEN